MATLAALDRLRLFLRPPGRGLLTVSTGGARARALLTKLYGSDDPNVVSAAWEDTLQKIRRAEKIGFGIPSDVGAGIVKGANWGPLGIREAYLSAHGQLPKDFLDLGDVATIPHLLHDEMLSNEQISQAAHALYEGRGTGLPVSPLSIAENVMTTLWELNPQAKIAMLGGDHSVSWPVVASYARRFRDDLGILHFDAHTDLLPARFGVKHCFATWAYHAMKLLPAYRMVQVGIRVSGKPKSHWESTYPVTQVWANEVPGREELVLEQIVEKYQAQGVRKLYVTNDIDGTDSQWASATGTPEANGLTPEFVITLIRRLAKEFEIVGGDVVEVAPPLSGRTEYHDEPTCRLAAEYWKVLIEAMK